MGTLSLAKKIIIFYYHKTLIFMLSSPCTMVLITVVVKRAHLLSSFFRISFRLEHTKCLMFSIRGYFHQ